MLELVRVFATVCSSLGNYTRHPLAEIGQIPFLFELKAKASVEKDVQTRITSTGSSKHPNKQHHKFSNRLAVV